MKTGFYISGAAHLGLIAWVLFGGLFLRPDDVPSLENTQVSLLSSEEFAALMPPEIPPQAEPETAAPQDPEVDAPTPPAEDENPPELPVEPEQPLPPTEPNEAVVEDQPPTDIQTINPQEVPLAPIAPEASLRPSARVSPDPVIDDAPDVTEDILSQEATESVAAPEAEPAPEVDETTAPEDASDRIVAEAEAPPASSPASSARPPARPNRPQPTEPVNDQNADIMAALSEANQTPATQPAPSGPPLSSGEKDALRISVSRCWNVNSLSAEALLTTVIVAVDMSIDGKPDVGSIRLVSSSGGSNVAADVAYGAARRAIIICGQQGFDLPKEKYDHWKELEITFDPEKMRTR